MLVNIARLHWRAFLLHSFVALGGCWTVLELYLAVTDTQPGNYGTAVLAAVVLLSFAIGFFVTWRKLAGAEFVLRGTSTGIKVSFGNIFDRSSALVVPVNEYFDHCLSHPVDGQAAPVSEKSVHGQVVAKFGETEFRKAVDASLSSAAASLDDKRELNPKHVYPLGTVASISENGRQYFLVATTKTDPATNAARAKLTEVFSALTDAWVAIRTVSDDAALAVPLVGSGFARARIDYEHLLDLIIASIVEVSLQEEGRIAPKIEIVLPESVRGTIRCYNVKAEWS